MDKATKYISAGFAVVGGYFLLTEHRTHVIEYLPYVLLLACPLVHLFHGHGGHGGDHGKDTKPRLDSANSQP